MSKRKPGEVRDAVVQILASYPRGASPAKIHREVCTRIGEVAASSVRSYLNLNTPGLFAKQDRGSYTLDSLSRHNGELNRAAVKPARTHRSGLYELVEADCLEWLSQRTERSIHAVVTDPPYGLIEYSAENQAKLRQGKGGIWRIPPSFDGATRSPLPRFTVLKSDDIRRLEDFFLVWARTLWPALVPGANVVVASNPLLSYVVAGSVVRGGFERRGEIVRLVMTMRGGDRPKAAHTEFPEVSVMPRSMWEPWLVFRKPLEGRVQDNLRAWKTGGFRRISDEKPFGDVIHSAPTHVTEKRLAPHPSLKPQAFLRKLVRAVLPLGEGIVLDPFAGAGSTLAAAEVVGYASIGIERERRFFDMARASIADLATLDSRSS